MILRNNRHSEFRIPLHSISSTTATLERGATYLTLTIFKSIAEVQSNQLNRMFNQLLADARDRDIPDYIKFKWLCKLQAVRLLDGRFPNESKYCNINTIWENYCTNGFLEGVRCGDSPLREVDDGPIVSNHETTRATFICHKI